MEGNSLNQGMADESIIEGSSEKEVEIVYVEEPLVGEEVVDVNPNPESNFDGSAAANGQHEGSNATVVDNETPRVGMVFKTFEEVYGFYNQYARKVGFGTKIRRSWYSLDDGQCNKFMLTCCKEGKREYKNSERCSSYRLRLSARTDCQARIKVIKRYADGLFHVTEVILEHNHPVNPSMSQFFRSHRGVNDGGKKMPVMRGKGHRELASVETEGESSIGKARTSFLGRDDIEALHQFVTSMQSSNSNFFYLMDLDEDGRLRNVFWADGRCKTEYQYFGDVVSLDTTYLVNNYETPLVSFIGANHHGHSILFGCGLLSDRSVETYKWLFKSWLSCMSGTPPNAIITYQCKAIQEAVAEVFPAARHRMCLWHIMKRIQENLAGCAEHKAIKETMKQAVQDSVRVEEFEEDWRNMIEMYGLENNEWLKSLYENRHYWVPVFVKEAFWGGMSNVQHKENLTSFFDGRIYPNTSLKQFLCKYETTLQSKFEKEVQADLDSFNKSPQLISKFYMEDQLRQIYTVDMFKKFQEEVKAILYCNTALVRVDGPISIFEVKEPLRMKDGNQMENKDYEVMYNANEQDVQCICCYFQSIGILCRHTLSVLNFLEVYEIPPQFIVDRWRKDYKHRHGLAYSSNDAMANGPMERHDNLYKRCLRFVELGVISDEHYEYALKLISEVTEELIANDCTIGDMLPRNPTGRNMRNEDDDTRDSGHDIGQVRQKGQLPKKRKDSLADKVAKSSRKKPSQRKAVGGDQNDMLRVAPDTPHFDPQIWTQDSINLAEQISPTNLSVGNHFGMQLNHPHTLDNQSGIRWSFQQMFQQAHTADAPPGPWSG